MLLAASPLTTTLMRSASLGASPAGVDLYLNWPSVKSRGLGMSDGAPGPLPRPSAPWQTAHRFAYTVADTLTPAAYSPRYPARRVTYVRRARLRAHSAHVAACSLQPHRSL